MYLPQKLISTTFIANQYATTKLYFQAIQSLLYA